MLWFDRHRRMRAQLSAYIDGALDTPAVDRVEAHLADCERCSEEMEDLRATIAALQEIPQAEVPRSFVLSPEQAAARRPPQPAVPLAFGLRMAAAGVAVALVAVVMVDLGGFGGGAPQEATAPGITTERQADEAGMEARGAAPDAGEEKETPDAEMSPLYDDGAGEGEGAPAAAGGMEPSPVPTSPPGATVVPPGAEEAPVSGGLTPETEAGAKQAAPLSPGGGGIDALKAAEIGLAAALGVLITGSVVLAFAGRKR